VSAAAPISSAPVRELPDAGALTRLARAAAVMASACRV